MSEEALSNRHLIDEVEQYRRLLDNIPAEIGVFDPDGRFLFNTPSGIRDAKTREWVLGKTHHQSSVIALLHVPGYRQIRRSIGVGVAVAAAALFSMEHLSPPPIRTRLPA